MRTEHVYTAPRSMTDQQRDALLMAWSALKWEALDAITQGYSGRIAGERARNLVQAFGVRFDGKRKRTRRGTR